MYDYGTRASIMYKKLHSFGFFKFINVLFLHTSSLHFWISRFHMKLGRGFSMLGLFSANVVMEVALEPNFSSL